MHRLWLRLVVVALLGLVAMSCATSKDLTRRSENALKGRDDARAYVLAVKALAKDRSNGRARAALNTAASRLLEARRQRALNIAAEDTLRAAEACLDYDKFRHQAEGDGAELVFDSDFAARARGIRRAASDVLYADATSRLREHEPKLAYREFTRARNYSPGYRDLDAMVKRSWDLAVTRVATLPFNDDAHAPEVARAITEHMNEQLASRVHSNGFEFTEILPMSRVYEALRVSQLGRLSRDDALEVGRALGARQVVFGRIGGVNTMSDTDRYHGTIWRKFPERDTAGHTVERWVDVPFDAVQRWRQVRLTVDFEVADVMSEAQLEKKSRDVDATARTVYTNYEPEGDCGTYRLVPPTLKTKDPERSTRIEADWTGTFHHWTVPKLLERARRDHSRTRYKNEFRIDFAGLDPDYPVFMDDLPPADELVRIALEDQWKDVLDVLRELDPKD